MMFDLNGKNILVFGGAGYLGSSNCRAVAAAGANVIIVDLNLERAKVLADELRRDYPSSSFHAAGAVDALDSQAVSLFFEQLKNKYTRLDGMVCAITAGLAGDVEDISAELMNEHFSRHVTSAFILARAAKVMMESGGNIVLYSSMYGAVAPHPEIYYSPMKVNPVAYGMCKAAINQMTRYLAVHWSPDNIRVNAVAPGSFPNPAIQQKYPDFTVRLSDLAPMRRIGQQHELDGAVVYLLSQASSYMTGQILHVNGGWTCW